MAQHVRVVIIMISCSTFLYRTMWNLWNCLKKSLIKFFQFVKKQMAEKLSQRRENYSQLVVRYGVSVQNYTFYFCTIHLNFPFFLGWGGIKKKQKKTNSITGLKYMVIDITLHSIKSNLLRKLLFKHKSVLLNGRRHRCPI